MSLIFIVFASFGMGFVAFLLVGLALNSPLMGGVAFVVAFIVFAVALYRKHKSTGTRLRFGLKEVGLVVLVAISVVAIKIVIQDKTDLEKPRPRPTSDITNSEVTHVTGKMADDELVQLQGQLRNLGYYFIEDDEPNRAEINWSLSSISAIEGIDLANETPKVVQTTLSLMEREFDRVSNLDAHIPPVSSFISLSLLGGRTIRCGLALRDFKAKLAGIVDRLVDLQAAQKLSEEGLVDRISRLVVAAGWSAKKEHPEDGVTCGEIFREWNLFHSSIKNGLQKL